MTLQIKNKSTIFLVAMLFPILLLLSNLKLAKYACYNGYDFGIYQQAIYELAGFENLNPFVYIRGIKIFNDHADPVVFIPAVLVSVLGESSSLLVIFEWLTVFAIIPVIWKWGKSLRPLHLAFILSFIIFGRGTLSAINYPIHASVWSWCVWFAWTWAILSKNKWQYVLSFALCFFKESYPFVLITLTGLFFLEKEFKRGLIHGIIALFGLFCSFYLRPLFLGPTYKHGDALLSKIIYTPFHTLFDALLGLDYILAFKILGPIIIVTLLALKTNKKYLIPLLSLFPIFLLQLLINKFGFQYSYLFYAVASAVLLKSLIDKPALHNKWPMIGVLFLLITGMSYYTKAVSVLAGQESKKCSFSEQRLTDIEEARKIINSLPSSTDIISTGGILSAIVTKNKKIHHMMSHGDIQSSYQVAILESIGSGDIHPLTKESLLTAQNCVLKNSKILYQSSGLLIAQGEFFNTCWLGNPESISL